MYPVASDMQRKQVCEMGQYELRFESETDVEEYFVQKAEQELRETEQKKIEALAELKRMIAEEPALHIPLENNDMYLLGFLRSCKYYPESAFKKIKYLCKFKVKYPKYFENIVPMTEKTAFENNLITVSPQRDQYGRRILIVQAGRKWDPSRCSLVDITRGVLLAIEAAILETRTQIAGAVLILDLEGLAIHHVWQLSASYAKMALDWIQDAVPLRTKAVHIINQPYVFNMAFAIFRPFIREKLRNRIHLHGKDKASLMDHIDAKSVPVCYGGMMDISLDEGFNIWKFFCQFNDVYEMTAKFGYQIKEK